MNEDLVNEDLGSLPYKVHELMRMNFVAHTLSFLVLRSGYQTTDFQLYDTVLHKPFPLLSEQFMT